MRKFFLVALGCLCSLSVLPACGSVSFSGKSTPAETAAQTQNATNSEAANDAVVTDCDAYMQEFADQCFKVTVYEEDGTLRNDVDENGNVLGPVDQGWAADYCTCFAQTAFQTFGCSNVSANESLDDAAWLEKYAPIQEACVEMVQNPNDVVEDSSNVEAVDTAESVEAVQ